MPAHPGVITEAKRLLAVDYVVVPVKGKVPIYSDWRAKPRSPKQVLRDLSTIFVVTGIGFPGGAINHGVVPLDFDKPEAWQWWIDNCRKAGIDPNSFPTVVTPGKARHGGRVPGRHVYVRDARGTLTNSAGKLRELGIDVRGHGHVVLPPSPHPDGGIYKWVNGGLTDWEDVPICPDFVYEAIEAKPAPSAAGTHTKATADQRVRRYCLAALDNQRQALAAERSGARNEALNKAAHSLGRLAHYGAFTEAMAREALRAACIDNGLLNDDGAKAFVDTFASGWKAGMGAPKELDLEDRAQHPDPRAAETGERHARTNGAAANGNGSADGASNCGPDHGAHAEDVGADQQARDGAADTAAETGAKVQKTTLRVAGGELHRLVDQAQDLLVAADGVEIFQRAGMLVRIVRVDHSTPRRSITRRDGALTIAPVTSDHLVVTLTNAGGWEKYDARTKKFVQIDAPEKIANGILAMAGSWKFPTLAAVIEAPTLRPDGTILDRPGYDQATGLYFAPGVQGFEPIPEAPTQADAAEAVNVVADLLDEFPFVDAGDGESLARDTASFSVALAAIITALVRRSVRTAPLFGFSAPMMGSGKSLLADIVAMISTGRPAAVMSYANDPAEDRKKLMAALIAGDTVIVLDNVEEPLGSDALCSILTQEVYRDRILGLSQNLSVPTCTTFLATGNNLSMKGDLSTRALIARLDARCEHPEARQFDIDLYTDVPKRRADLVKAALTIVRAYIVAGKPKQQLQPYGRFDEWSEFVRYPLVWCGLKDPCSSRLSIEDEDPERMKLGALLLGWEAVFGSSPTEISQVVKTYKNGVGEEADHLRSALDPWVERGEVNTRKLGWFIAGKAKRIQGGLQFEKVRDKGCSAAVWRVVAIRP